MGFKERKGMLLLFCVVIAGLMLTAAALLLRGNRFYLELALTGDSEMVLEYGESFRDPGADAVYCGTRIFRGGIKAAAEVEVLGTVEENKLGTYTVTYAARYRDCTAQAQRTVRIVDTRKPVIELKPDGGWTADGERYPEPGYLAMDNYDGDITERVAVTQETGRIVYTVTDSSGNTETAVRELPGYDPIHPQITLEGGAKILLTVGQPYSELGFTASDNLDGNLTEQVVVEGEVDRFVPGNYPILYSVKDSYGNLTTVVRSVEVLKIPRPEQIVPEGKVIYLTFDDGPCGNTPALLDVLDKYQVKATFFVVDSGKPDVMKQIVDRGHGIGIHTRTHDYDVIYDSPEAFFDDLYAMQDIIYQATGVRTTLMRFPGGSSNTISAKREGIMTFLTGAVQDAGFQYFDWNVDSNDAGGSRKTAEVLINMKEGILEHRISVVLQHDIHSWSVDAVEELILWALDNGYSFLALNASSPQCHHTVRN